MSRAKPLPWAAVLCLAGCYASNVVAPAERAVVETAPALVWRAAAARDLEGFWESTEITGASAGVVLEAWTWFGAAGDYSSGALVIDEGRPRFVVVADRGRWTLEGSSLDLNDGSEPVRPEVADGHLRLVGAEASMTFRRVPLD